MLLSKAIDFWSGLAKNPFNRIYIALIDNSNSLEDKHGYELIQYRCKIVNCCPIPNTNIYYSVFLLLVYKNIKIETV